jgi:hypothetical protein
MGMAMSSHPAVARLVDHQLQILNILNGAEPLLIDPAKRDVAALARARWALMRALTAYQLFKRHEVFDPLLAKARPADAYHLVRMKRACTDLGDAFRHYVQRWSSTDVEAHWAEYQPAALAMITRIREHIAREREQVGKVLRT